MIVYPARVVKKRVGSAAMGVDVVEPKVRIDPYATC
jgi:hypothetical protein